MRPSEREPGAEGYDRRLGRAFGMARISKVRNRAFSGITRMAMGACVLLLTASLAGCALTTPPRSEVQRETVESTVADSSLIVAGTLTVGLDTTDAPQAMNGSDGTPIGYYVDVARALAQRMGLKVAFASSSGASGAIKDKKADIFLGATSHDAGDGIKVTGSLIENASAVFAKTGDGRQSSISADQLAGATVAVQEASASQDALNRAGITAEQKTYANVNECFEALAKGEVQYVACDATAGAYLARAYSGIAFAGTISTASSAGIATPSDGELADAVSTAYDSLEQDGTLDALHATWYGSLPLSLSDKALSGVTISSNADAGTDTATGDEAAATDTPISDDINSIG